MKTKLTFLSLFLCLITISINAQNHSLDEQVDDPYIAVPDELKVKTPAYRMHNSGISIIQVNVDENGNNIGGDAANEPSIAIDPTDPQRMVIGWRQFETIESNFRQAGIAYSLDGGNTWINEEVIEPGVFRSDPVLDTDSDGNFYYNSLSQDFNCDVFKTNIPSEWSTKVPANGGDKQWMVIDKTTQNSNGHVYAFWKTTFSVCDGAFTRSTDSGMSFDSCSSYPTNITRGTLSVGPDGNLYAFGEDFGTFTVMKSSTAQNPSSDVEWELVVDVPMNGGLARYNGPNPGGLLGQAWIATDHSETDNYGNVYTLATVERSDNSDPADIMFSRSTDGGMTWSEAIRINDDLGVDSWQWFGTMSVAPNGRIDVVWVDTRGTGTFLSELYYSYSIDGGLTWSVNEKLTEGFNPHDGWPNQNKLGDYYHMISDNEGAHLAWAATFNGEQDVYYSYLTPTPITSTDEIFTIDQNAFDLEVFPNPVRDQMVINFTNTKRSEISIELKNIEGRLVERLAEGEFIKGEHTISVTQNQLNHLEKGIYILQIKNEFKESSYRKVVFY